MKRKIAILGTASHFSQAPFFDDEFEIWILNDMYDIVPRYDVLFNLHSYEDNEKHIARVSNTLHIDNLRNITDDDKIIVMQDAYKDIPRAVKYPLQKMLEIHGRKFTSTIAYMLALALDKEEVDEMHLYGVDMSNETEYAHQREACAYFIGLARGEGIKVVINKESSLLKVNYLYGYESEKANEFISKCKKRLQFMEKQKEQTENQIKNLKMLLNRTEGAIDNIKYTMNTF